MQDDGVHDSSLHMVGSWVVGTTQTTSRSSSRRESLAMVVLPGSPPRSARWPTVKIVDNRAEVREFLTSRRARIRPEDVGLPPGSGRRVSGLRRSEVATLAGVSVEYYTRLESG